MEHKQSRHTRPHCHHILSLSLKLLVVSGVFVLSLLLTSCTANLQSIDFEPTTPIFNKSTETSVSPTRTDLPSETLVSPTRTVATAPTQIPAEAQPTPTVPTVYNEWGWPVLVDMPAEDMQPVDCGHAGHVGLVPLTTDVETSLLVDYTNPDISLPDSLQLLIEYVYPDVDFYAVTRDSIGPILQVVKPSTSESVEFTFPCEFLYYKLTSSEVCQMIEAANLYGYGLAGQPGQTLQSAFEILIFQYGDPFGRTSSMIFYCSNFDPASPDFLSIALDLGYVDLVAALQK